MTRISVALLAAAVVSISPLNAGQSATFKTTRATVTGITVIANTGHGGSIGGGDNPLDEPTQFTCNGATGCLVTIQAMVGVELGRGFLKICGKIDELEAEPKCPRQNVVIPNPTMTDNSLQVIEIDSGEHTAQTILHMHPFERGDKLKLQGWTVTYTIYEH